MILFVKREPLGGKELTALRNKNTEIQHVWSFSFNNKLYLLTKISNETTIIYT